jgi:small GTP-binding protein
MIRKKILLIGDFNVGKTSLIRRYVDNAFDDRYLTTIGVKISKKKLLINEQECELLIWDLEGVTPQKSIPKTYYGGAAGAIFVGDVSRSETMKNIDEHIEVFKQINPNGHYVIAYNKSDLLKSDQMRSFQSTENVFLTSAKNDINVDTMFISLAKEIFND